MPVETTSDTTTPVPRHAMPELEAGPRIRYAAKIALRYALLTALALVVLFPIYITVVNSLLRPDQIASRPPSLFPSAPQWHTYADAWNEGHLGRYLLNSFIVTTIIVAGE